MPPHDSFHFRTSCLLAALVAMCTTGCGSSTNTVKVRGHAAYRGESLTNGTVTFFPASGRPMIAPLSEEGDYTAELAPGEYEVVMMIGTKPPEGYKEGDPLPPPKITLPDEYTIRAKSKLKASVAPGQSEAIDF